MKHKHVIDGKAELEAISEKLASKLNSIPAEKWEHQGDKREGNIKTTLDNGIKVEISARKYESGCPAGSGDSIWYSYHTLKVSDGSSELIVKENEDLTRLSNERYMRGEETLYPARTYDKIMLEKQKEEESKKADQERESDFKAKSLLDKL